MALRRNSIRCRFVANSSPLKSLISCSSATIIVNFAIVAGVIAVPGAMLRVCSIALRRFRSEKKTTPLIGFSGPSGLGDKSSSYSAATTSGKPAVHASRCIRPFSPTSCSKPKLCKSVFLSILSRNTPVSNPTAAAACAASTVP